MVGRSARHLVTCIYVQEAETVVLTSTMPFVFILGPSLHDGATTPSSSLSPSWEHLHRHTQTGVK